MAIPCPTKTSDRWKKLLEKHQGDETKAYVHYFRDEIGGKPVPAVEPAPEPPSSAFSDFLKAQNRSDGLDPSKWPEEDYKAAQAYSEGDESALDHLPPGKQRRIKNQSTEFLAQTPEGLKKIQDYEAKFRTKGTNEKSDYVPGSVKNAPPKPTEDHPFQYRIHDLLVTLPSGKEQFAGATINADGTIPKQVWDSKTSNIPKSEKGLYESLVPEAFKDNKVNVKMLDEKLKDLPSVQVHMYGMEGKPNPDKLALDEMTHDWLDALPHGRQVEWGDSLAHDDDSEQLKFLEDAGWSKADLDKAEKYMELQRAVKNNPHTDSGPRATQYYKTISPFDTDKFPVQRIDVVLPRTDPLVIEANKPKSGWEGTSGNLWSPDNLHENLPNTLGWVMGQVVPHPEGGKTFFIGELQSRWGQERSRDVKDTNERIKSGNLTPEAKPLTPDHPLLQNWEALTLKAAVDSVKRQNEKAIAENRPQDVIKSVTLSDGESAMITEGHDKAASDSLRVVANDKNRAIMNDRSNDLVMKGIMSGSQADVIKEKLVKGEDSVWDMTGYGQKAIDRILNDFKEAGLDHSRERKPSQEGGMRAQYDKRGPDILRKITGVEGKMEDFGVHKNAREASEAQRLADVGVHDSNEARQNLTDAGYTISNTGEVRSGTGEYSGVFEDGDLIDSPTNVSRIAGGQKPEPEIKGSPVFKDAQGNPKTNVTGRSFDISKVQDTGFKYSPKTRFSGTEKEQHDLHALVTSNKSTVRDGLKLISTMEGSKYKDLASELLEIASKEGLDAKVFTKNWGDDKASRSAYHPDSHAVRIGTGDTTSVGDFVHEAFHALTSRKLEASIGSHAMRGKEFVKALDVARANPETPQPVKDLIDIYRQALKKMGFEDKVFGNEPGKQSVANRPDMAVKRGVPYGLSNLDEFMSEAHTNEEFQKQLNDIQGSGGKSLWKSFVDAVRRLLGMPLNRGSLLEDVMKATTGVMKLPNAKHYSSSPSYNAEIPQMPHFSPERAAMEKEQYVNEGIDPGQIALMQAFGQNTDHAYVVQAYKPMKDFSQSKLFGKIGTPEINPKNTASVKAAYEALSNQDEYGSNFSQQFREWARSTDEPVLQEHRGEASAGVLHNEIYYYAKRLAAEHSDEAPFMLSVLRTSGDTVLNDALTTSSGARALQVRSMSDQGMGLKQGIKQLDQAKDEAIDKGFGRGEVAKVQKEVESPTKETAQKAVDEAVKGPDVDQAARDAQKIVIDEERDMKKPTDDAQRIIDSIDKSHTETLIPDKARGKVRDLATAALKDIRTDQSRPGFLNQDEFMKRYSEGFMALGVEKDTAINLAHRLYGENMEKISNTDRRRLDRVAKGHGVSDLVKDLLSDPSNRLADPAAIKDKGMAWLRKAGFTEEQASRYYGKYEKLFQSKLNEARIKAFDTAMKGLKTVAPVTMDKIRTSLRNGIIPDIRDALANQLGFKGLTNDQVSELAKMDLKLQSAGPSQTFGIYREMADMLHKASPEMSWAKRIYKSFVNSALSGLSTIGLHYTQPAFATTTRLGTEVAKIMSDVARGRGTAHEIPQKIGTLFKDYIGSYRGYVDTLKRSYKNDAYTISHADTLKDLETLGVDMDRQIEKIKNGTPGQKLDGYMKLMFASTNITHKMLMSGVEASARTMQNFFHVRGARDLMRGQLTDEEMSKAITEAQKRGDEVGLFAQKQGATPEEASGQAIDATNKYIRELVDEHLGEGKGDELGDYSDRETKLETGNRKGEAGAGWDVFNHMAETAKDIAYAARRQNELFGRMLTGFVSIPTNLINRSLSFTPYGLARAFQKSHGSNSSKLYTESMGNDLQLHQRYLEGVVGSVATATAMALFLSRDQNDPNYTGPRVTLYGPKNANLRDSWLKGGNKPGSLEWVENGKVRFSLNYSRGGPESLKLPLVAIGALDDMKLNGTLGKENAVEGVGDYLKTLASGGLKSASFFGLKNISEIPQLTEASDKSVASNIAWTTSALMPWSGFVKSVSKIATGPLDQSSVRSALIAQTPFLSLFGEPSINMLGDTKGEMPEDALTKYSDRASYSGLPFYIGNNPDNKNAKVYSFFMDKGISPAAPSRSALAQKNGFVSDQKFYNYTKARGYLIKDGIVNDMKHLRSLKDVELEDAMRSIENRATKDAKTKLGLK